MGVYDIGDDPVSFSQKHFEICPELCKFALEIRKHFEEWMQIIAYSRGSSMSVSKKLVKNVSLKTLKDEKKLCFLFWKWRIFFVLLPTEYL